jgi:hypothetical protein
MADTELKPEAIPDYKHDPHCDCGICAYCNGEEDVWGNKSRTDLAPTVVDARRIENAAEEIQLTFLPDHRTATDALIIREAIRAIILRHVTARSGGEKI